MRSLAVFLLAASLQGAERVIAYHFDNAMTLGPCKFAPRVSNRLSCRHPIPLAYISGSLVTPTKGGGLMRPSPRIADQMVGKPLLPFCVEHGRARIFAVDVAMSGSVDPVLVESTGGEEDDEEEGNMEPDPELDEAIDDVDEEELVSLSYATPDFASCIKRSFLPAGSGQGAALASNEMRIVTYNVLGPLQAISSKHKYSPIEVRHWPYRLALILAELEGYDADVVCLQEVTPETFKDDFAPWFKERGFRQQYYQPKRHPPGSQAAKRDVGRLLAGRKGRRGTFLHSCLGTATFVKDDRWRVVASERVILNSKLPLLGAGQAPEQPRPQPSQKQHEGSVSKRARRKERGKNKGVPEEVCASLGNDLKRLPDTAVLTLLEPTPPPGKGKLSAGGGRVLVANCHLFWNPKRPDIKTVQAALLCRAASSFLAAASKGPHGRGPHAWPDKGLGVSGCILLGDMNSVPNLQPGYCKQDQVEEWTGDRDSGVWSLLNKGVVSPGHPEHPSAFGTCRKLGSIESGLDLFNAYNAPGGPGQPSITTKTDQFSGCIDHIWCTSSPPLGGEGAGLEVTELLAMPWGDAGVEAFRPIPDALWGSDHLSLGVTVRVPPPA